MNYKKVINKKFEEMLKQSVKPFGQEPREEEKQKTDGYTDKKIHPHKVEDALEKPRGKSR